MNILDKVSLRKMLQGRKKCRHCGGRGYVLYLRPDLDATKFREVRPCSCIKQLVRIEQDTK